MNLLDETINIHCVYALLCTPQSHLLSMYEKFEYCTDSCIRLSWTSAAIYHEWLERCIVAWVDAGDVFIVSAQFRGAPVAWYRNSRNRLCIYTPTLGRTPISLTPSTVLRSSTYVDLRSRLMGSSFMRTTRSTSSSNLNSGQTYKISRQVGN